MENKFKKMHFIKFTTQAVVLLLYDCSLFQTKGVRMSLLKTIIKIAITAEVLGILGYGVKKSSKSMIKRI